MSEIDVFNLIKDLKKRDDCYTDYTNVKKALDFTKKIITSDNWNSINQLIENVKAVGSKIETYLPKQIAIVNVIRHILKIIRSEFESNDDNKCENLQHLILNHLSEYDSELEMCLNDISEQSLDYIYNCDIIMTIGTCPFVERFLKNAAKKRQFHVIVPEQERKFMERLKLYKITVTVIQNSAIFAVMSRVSKVILSANVVSANGNIKAECGSLTIALAAKHYAVPVFILTPLYNCSPMFQNDFNSLTCSRKVFHENLDSIQVFNPTFDSVPFELITLIITQHGAYLAAFIHHLLKELYDENDYNFN